MAPQNLQNVQMSILNPQPITPNAQTYPTFDYPSPLGHHFHQRPTRSRRKSNSTQDHHEHLL